MDPKGGGDFRITPLLFVDDVVPLASLSLSLERFEAERKVAGMLRPWVTRGWNTLLRLGLRQGA